MYPTHQPEAKMSRREFDGANTSAGHATFAQDSSLVPFGASVAFAAARARHAAFFPNLDRLVK